MPHPESNRLAVVGGTIAGLATAIVAARAGYGVDFYLEPARLGGSFAGITAAAGRFDLGCRLFELEYEPATPTPFDPDHSSHRPLIHGIADFIRRILGEDLRRTAEPEMWINGRRTRCPLMTVNLADFAQALSADDQRAIRAELAFARHAPPEADLRAASVMQHGARLHERLIAPLCAKQSPEWGSTLAVYRRKLWTTLFHPETLRQAFGHGDIAFKPHRPFETTRSGAAYPFVDRLYDAVRAEPGIACIAAPGLKHLEHGGDGTLSLGFGANPAITLPAGTTVLALPPEQLFRAVGLPYAPVRLPASILWVDVPEAAVLRLPSSLMISDPSLAPFRISGAGEAPGGRRVLCLEFGADRPDHDAALAALRATGTIVDTCPIRPLHSVTGLGQVAPTAANRALFDQALAQFRSLGPQPILVGNARRFGWDSLNDQIADALHFGVSYL